MKGGTSSDAVPAAPTSEHRLIARSLLLDAIAPHQRQLLLAVTYAVVATLAALTVPYLVKYGIDDAIVAGRSPRLGEIVLLLLMAATVAAVFQTLAVRAFGTLAECVIDDLRVQAWQHLHSLSVDYFERNTSGAVMSRLTSDIDAVEELFWGTSLTVVPNLLLMMGIAVALFTIDAVLALLVLATVLPLLITALWTFSRRSTSAYRRVREKIVPIMTRLRESIVGMRILQGFGQEAANQAVLEALNRDYSYAKTRAARLHSVYWPFIQLVGHIALFLVVVVGGLRAIDGQITVGGIAALVLYLRLFFDPMLELSQFHNSYQAGFAGLERIAALLMTQPTVSEADSALPIDSTAGHIRLADVTFSYERGAPALRGLSLDIQPGSTVVLVGSTGAGKSTIAKLIARFHDPAAGTVHLDDRDLRELRLADLRRAVAVLPQDPHLLRGSIHDNIVFGRNGTTPDEVYAAARLVHADAFIEALPCQYDTDVAQQGLRLSAGQRQLIALARAFLYRPPVMILDEAMSALDRRSELAVHRALVSDRAHRTTIIISHRLSAIDIADQVAVVRHGRIVESGTPDELLQHDGALASLYRQWERRGQAASVE